MSDKPPAGWYPDRNNANGQRYWDGEKWTDQRRDEPPAMPVQSWKIVAAVLAALVLPILGLIIGIAMWRRHRTGAIIVLIVTAVSALWYATRFAG